MKTDKSHVHKYEDYRRQEFERTVREGIGLPKTSDMFMKVTDNGAILFLAAFITAIIFGLLKFASWALGSIF